MRIIHILVSLAIKTQPFANIWKMPLAFFAPPSNYAPVKVPESGFVGYVVLNNNFL